MLSVRLDPTLDDQVRRAADAEGTTVSDFIREAVADRAKRTLEQRPADRLGDVIGSVHGGGGRARRPGRALVEVLDARRHKK